jgi:hypothetical protein
MLKAVTNTGRHCDLYSDVSSVPMASAQTLDFAASSMLLVFGHRVIDVHLKRTF